MNTQFYKKHTRRLQDTNGHNSVIVSDFNSTLSPIDKAFGQKINKQRNTYIK